jgi:hypothetical protein
MTLKLKFRIDSPFGVATCISAIDFYQAAGDTKLRDKRLRFGVCGLLPWCSHSHSLVRRGAAFQGVEAWLQSEFGKELDASWGWLSNASD